MKGSLVTLDVTGIAGWKDKRTGIQRVVLELVPLLCQRIWRQGGAVELVRSTPWGNSHFVWSSRDPVPNEQLGEILNQVAYVDPFALPAAPSTPAPLLGQLKNALAAVPSLRAALNRSRLFRLAAQRVEERWLPRAAPSPAPRPLCDYYLGLTAGLMHVAVPPHLDRSRVLLVLNDIIPIKHREVVSQELYDFFVRESCSLAQRWGLRYATASQAAGQDWRRFLTAHGQREPFIETVYYGYDRRTFYPEPDPGFRRKLGLPDDAFVILSVSTIADRRKRFPDLAEAVRLCGDHAPVYAVLVGDREGAREIDAAHVRYLGYVDDASLRRAYSSCDAYVNWSLSEGFGLPLVEALACGATAVVAPDCETLLEVGGSDVVVPSSATPASLAETLLQLRAARPPRHVPDLSRYDWASTADDLLALLVDGMAHRGRNGKRAPTPGLALT